MKKNNESKKLAKKDTVILLSSVPEDGDISAKVKKELKLDPFGPNVIMDKRSLVKLQNIFLELKENTIPEDIYDILIKHLNEIRACLGIISFEEYEEERRRVFTKTFVPTFEKYNCKCTRKRKRE